MQKSKKYFNAKNKNQNLKVYLENQIKLKKHDHALQQRVLNQYTTEPESVIRQKSQLPLYGKLAYTYGFLMKYILTTLFFLLLIVPFMVIFEDVLFPQPYMNADKFLANFWYFLFLIPLAAILSLIPFTVYRKKLIKNYRISEDSFDIIYANNKTKSIAYADINYVTSIYGGIGTRIFIISFNCGESNQSISNFPLFIEYISIFNIYPIHNQHQMLSSLLQQITIKNKYTHIDRLFLFMYHIDSATLKLDHKALFKDKLFWYIFWGISLSTCSAIIFYYISTSKA